ncbi:MAG: hypothetical protein WDO68_18635 [Gammaproteobacteria bacterium]
MPLHQNIQRLLLVGVHLDAPPAPAIPEPPSRLRPLIESLASAHRAFDEIAIRHGHRYRSGFWAIYLLSAAAVLCAMMPLALGWDSMTSFMHPFAAGWAIAEVAVIAAVGVIYWRGHHNDWQGAWLRARTVAELTSYLPLIAPLVDFSAVRAEQAGHRAPNWYPRALGPEQHPLGTPEVAELCGKNERQARELLDSAWSDPQFVFAYGAWAIGVLRAQQAYHKRVAERSHALQHRVHRITAVLFTLTAVGALAHLIVHSRWLSLITTVFPALAASLHGALAQSETYRLHATSERVALELRNAVVEIQRSLDMAVADSDAAPLKGAIRSAVALILEEHQDWHMLVKPHHLPLG